MIRSETLQRRILLFAIVLGCRAAARSQSDFEVLFNDVGISGFACAGSRSDYHRTHHPQADTFAKVDENEVVKSV